MTTDMTTDLLTGSRAAAPSRWFRANLWLHRWASLIATVPFLILCLTGTVLIFHEEIDAALGALPPSPGLAAEERPLAEAVNNALAAFPKERVAIAGMDPGDHPGLLLLGTVPVEDSGFENLTRRFAHLATAELTAAKESQRDSLTGFLFELHAEWFIGPVGAVIGAVIALFVVASLLSGMVVYGPYARRVAFGGFRHGRSPTLFQLDLHNFVGVIVLGWLLVVSLTGFCLGFGTIVTGLWAQNHLKGFQETAETMSVDIRNPPATVDNVYRAALSAAPAGWSIEAVIWPGTTFTTDRFYAVRITGSGLNKKLFRVMLVDAVTGAVTQTVELPWYMKTIALSQPLHFGDYGGLPLKLLWTACAWLTLFITANGAWLWWARRRRGNRARPAVAAT